MGAEIHGATKAAVRRSARAQGEAVITRRGHKLSVAVNGSVKDQRATALADTIDVGSSGFARLVERTWRQRREWYPDEHPILALHRARDAAQWALNHARRRAAGRRMSKWARAL